MELILLIIFLIVLNAWANSKTEENTAKKVNTPLPKKRVNRVNTIRRRTRTTILDMEFNVPKKEWILPNVKHWKSYEQYIQSEEWQASRKLILERDDYQCTMCGSNKTLQIHHITYENLYHENMNDLIVLCADCHTETHRNTTSETTIFTPKRKLK